jgi:hypothetical protein
MLRLKTRVARWYICIPKYQFWNILEALEHAMETFGVFHGPLVYSVDNWYFLLPLGIFYGRLVFFPRLGLLRQEKSGSLVENWILVASLEQIFGDYFPKVFRSHCFHYYIWLGLCMARKVKSML